MIVLETVAGGLGMKEVVFGSCSGRLIQKQGQAEQRVHGEGRPGAGGARRAPDPWLVLARIFVF